MRYLERLFWCAGAFLVGWFCFAQAQVHLFQMNQNAQVERAEADARATQPAEPTVSKTHLSPNMLVGRIEIPRVKVSAVIEEGDDSSILHKAVGHIPGTALPGEHGNVGLAAHRDTFFRALGKLREGDVIVLTTVHGTFRYRVASTGVVGPEQTSVLKPIGVPALTLVTCYPFRYIGPAPNRYIVTAFQSTLLSDDQVRRSDELRAISTQSDAEQ